MKVLEKEKLIEHILQDPAFSKSETSKKLLLYLLECSNERYFPNEMDIARHALGKGSDFDPSYDASVRVHISKLRKKLEEYYKTNGKHDKTRIIIPKRQYSVELQAKSNSQDRIQKLVKVVMPVAVLILCMVVVGLVIQNQTMRRQLPIANVTLKDSFIWQDFLDLKKSSVMAVGHVFAYCEYQDEYNSFRIVRNRLINSEQDLSDYMAHYNIPPERIWMPTWDIVPKYVLSHYNLIQPVFSSSSRFLDVKLSSHLAWQDFQDHHILYIGHFHNLGKLARFYQAKHFYSPSQNTDYTQLITYLDENREKHPESVLKDSIQASIENQMDALFVLYHEKAADSTREIFRYSYDEATKYVRDYAVLMKLPGPHQSQLLFIVSFHQIGRLTVIKTLTNHAQLKKFEDQVREKMGSLPQYFEMLIEVKGYEETSMEMEILHVYPVNSEFMLVNQ